MTVILFQFVLLIVKTEPSSFHAAEQSPTIALTNFDRPLTYVMLLPMPFPSAMMSATALLLLENVTVTSPVELWVLNTDMGSWDTEGYTSAISIVPDNGMMTSMLHWEAVMLHTSSLTFSTVTSPRRWVFASTVFCVYTASHGALLPDENARKPLWPPSTLNVTRALVVFIMNLLAPASGDWDTECYLYTTHEVNDVGSV